MTCNQEDSKKPNGGNFQLGLKGGLGCGHLDMYMMGVPSGENFSVKIIKRLNASVG